jgi:rhamnulokinase
MPELSREFPNGFRAAAVDLGGSGGRVVTAEIDADRVRIGAVYRFENRPFRDEAGLHWDLDKLYRDTVNALAQAQRLAAINSVGVDAWSGDYALFPQAGTAAPPFHQRDTRTLEILPVVHDIISHGELFRRTGANVLPISTLLQLVADRNAGRLEGARRVLLIPDAVTAWLGGSEGAEATNASTTGLALLGASGWDAELISRLGLPLTRLAPIVQPGTLVGQVEVPELTAHGCVPIQLTTVASHDTASAVAAIPACSPDVAYISCGTWGLVGVETQQPILTQAAEDIGFTNELGVDESNRFLRIAPGLWLLNECMREWGLGDQDSAERMRLLRDAAQLRVPAVLIDTNDQSLLRPDNMPTRIRDQLRNRGLVVPDTREKLVRLIIESLAATFAQALDEASMLSGVQIGTVHIVGGGSQLALLCQRVADRFGRRVVAGPVEATALGNLLIQARAHGVITGGLDRLREIVRASCETREYLPRTQAMIDEGARLLTR